jgi:glycosyltransferase involved in cell wall biosynthesis
MKDNIILCGKVTDKELLAAHYCRADLFLFPSLYDASSIVQIEAASQSTPTIFLKGAATAATITDNVNGFLADNSVEAYADKIIEVLKNRKLYEEASQNAYKDLYKNWDMVIEEVYKKYCNLIKKKKLQKKKKRFNIKIHK